MAVNVTLASATGALIEGLADSAVRVLIYEDLACPDSATFRRMLDEKLLPKYAASVAFVHRDFPLDKHPWAMPAAAAANYFAEVKPSLGAGFRRETLASIPQISEESLAEWVKAFAKKNGANPSEAVKALTDPARVRRVQEDVDQGLARGVSKTPTLYVGSQAFVERFEAEEVGRALDEALKPSK